MPKDLPRPMSTAKSKSAHAGIATRHRQRTNALKRQIKIDRRMIRQKKISDASTSLQKATISPADRLSLALFDSPFSLDNFLPCPSFAGPFAWSSTFRRISCGLRPFVRLPLRADQSKLQCTPPQRRSSQSSSLSDSTSSDSGSYSESTDDFMQDLSPLPWSPLVQNVDDLKSKPSRSSTLLSSTSTGTHHLSLMDMYESGQLVSRYTNVPSSKPTGVVKKRQGRQHRKSTLKFKADRFSKDTARSEQTFITARSRQSSSLAEMTCSYTLIRPTPSTALAQESAIGVTSPPSSPRGATEALYAAVEKYEISRPIPSPPSSPPVVLRPNLPRLIMPDPLSSRCDSLSTCKSDSTILDEHNVNVEQRFEGGSGS